MSDELKAAYGRLGLDRADFLASLHSYVNSFDVLRVEANVRLAERTPLRTFFHKKLTETADSLVWSLSCGNAIEKICGIEKLTLSNLKKVHAFHVKGSLPRDLDIMKLAEADIRFFLRLSKSPWALLREIMIFRVLIERSPRFEKFRTGKGATASRPADADETIRALHPAP